MLVDEAHRTTGGDLGNYLMAALPNATYIGFTGTPIDRLASGKGTFKVFGVDDPQGYLDKYSIAESIADGTTVPLHYALAPTDLRVDRETLDREFLDLREAEGVSDLDELNAVLDAGGAAQGDDEGPGAGGPDCRASWPSTSARTSSRWASRRSWWPWTARRAPVQGGARPLPAPGYSTVVYSPGTNDIEALKALLPHRGPGEAGPQGLPRKEALPKILIVTEKLLTGFDAPILYCMYLDKPMRDHVLLQAIARVNRPYEDDDGQAKPYGFVLDFVGIFEKLEKALAFDSDVVASVIRNLDVLRELFRTMMREQAAAYLPLTRGMDDKAKERAVVAMQDKEQREAFFTFFRQTAEPLRHPQPGRLPASVHRRLQQPGRPLCVGSPGVQRPGLRGPGVHPARRKNCSSSTRRAAMLEPPTVVYEIGQQQLAALRESSAADTVKVLNLRKLLAGLVEDEGGAKPYLLSIGERAQAVAQAYEDRQIDTREALKRFEALVQETVAAEDKRRTLDLDENAFAIYTELATVAPDVAPGQAQGINALFSRFPDYRWNTQQEGALRAELYKALIPIVGGAKMVAAANALLRLERA